MDEAAQSVCIMSQRDRDSMVLALLDVIVVLRHLPIKQLVQTPPPVQSESPP